MAYNYDDIGTIYPRSSDPSYIVSYYIKWVTTFWTHSNNIWYIGGYKQGSDRFGWFWFLK